MRKAANWKTHCSGWWAATTSAQLKGGDGKNWGIRKISKRKKWLEKGRVGTLTDTTTGKPLLLGFFEREGQFVKEKNSWGLA